LHHIFQNFDVFDNRSDAREALECYQRGAEIFPLNIMIYYIGKTDHASDIGDKNASQATPCTGIFSRHRQLIFSDSLGFWKAKAVVIAAADAKARSFRSSEFDVC
jgi:hypothetical protein